MYEKKPRSRVFAPLAETYRKLGMIDESLRILEKGIKIHPSYTLGYIVLANCYYDLQNFESAYNAIRAFIPGNLENLKLQKLFAKCCMKLGYLDEALNTYKNLLLLNPKDMFVADQIKLLEDDLIVNQENSTSLQSDSEAVSFDEDNWVSVDFSNSQSKTSQSPEQIEWEAEQDQLSKFKRDVEEKRLEIEEKPLDHEFYQEDFDNESENVVTAEEDELVKSQDEGPIITHTLVDLYCSQGHFDKAEQILKDILELHPNDLATHNKLSEVQDIMNNSRKEEQKEDYAALKREKIESLYHRYLEEIKLMATKNV